MSGSKWTLWILTVMFCAWRPVTAGTLTGKAHFPPISCCRFCFCEVQCEEKHRNEQLAQSAFCSQLIKSICFGVASTTTAASAFNIWPT